MSTEQYEYNPEQENVRTAALSIALLVRLTGARSIPPIVPSSSREFILERLPRELTETEVSAIGDQIYGLVGATSKRRIDAGAWNSGSHSFVPENYVPLVLPKHAQREAIQTTRDVLSWLGGISCLRRDVVTARNTIRPLMNLGGRRSRLQARRIERMVENIDDLPHLLFATHINDTSGL